MLHPEISVAAESHPSATLFDRLADDIRQRGYSVMPNAVPPALVEALRQQVQAMPATAFRAAGVGRAADFGHNPFVRSDAICWIDGSSAAGAAWLDWTAALQQALNRQLLLGLFSFESHFAHYAPGDFYRKHLDAFRGETNRVLSLVVYLNPGWQPVDGGELLLYREQPADPLRVTPAFATLVAFLSEEFPHEVLPARRDRYSIAGWFRVNNSTGQWLDPPR